MIRLNRPELATQLRSFAQCQGQVITRPALRVAVGGFYPEYQNESVAFEMHAHARFTNCTIGHGTIARTIRSDLAIGFEPRKPVLIQVANVLEVVAPTLPTVDADSARCRTTLFRWCEQGAEVVVGVKPIIGRIIQPIVAWDSVLAVAPHNCQQVATRNHAMMFA